ncbi:DUF4192 domain-containing protein [Paractinoplanes rishiriensis]|uniref:DUF4192 domain-containing protein n=1 Tax=Paractinoplanes rishiriensis TaxID=1050105 RepID=A0A919K937_9ACTN|nr:DUF4192 domain-containing protein [Actinoplanes rishiriensis]GIF01096.1 hypothetical protein Ari01nite_85600 [Actinoplanes rishiriensis]
MTESDATQLRSAADLLGMVPYVIGFHPTDSVVLLLLRPGHQLACGLRLDLDAPVEAIVAGLTPVIERQHVTGLVVIGYGPLSARDTLRHVIDTLDTIRPVIARFLLADGRYYCLRDACRCTAAGGVRFDPRATTVAAAATVQGKVAWRSRADLVALVDPDPVAQQQVREAMDRLPARMPNTSELMAAARQGVRLDDQQMAALAVTLHDRTARDLAWESTDDHMWQQDLWLDATRRIPDSHVARPAALAAWCAWRRGNEVLARAALQRIASTGRLDLLASIVFALVDNHTDPRSLPWPLPAGITVADLLQQD